MLLVNPVLCLNHQMFSFVFTVHTTAVVILNGILGNGSQAVVRGNPVLACAFVSQTQKLSQLLLPCAWLLIIAKAPLSLD